MELDELYHFLGEKAKTQTHENIYLITMVSENPRQIVGFDVAFDKSPQRIEDIVWSAPPALQYRTDGYLGYIDVIYPGRHIRNACDKNDTYTAESINSDIRHYLKVFSRRTKCFPRKLENLKAIITLFVYAFNRFGRYKSKNQKLAKHKPSSLTRHSHKYSDSKKSLIDFLF